MSTLPRKTVPGVAFEFGQQVWHRANVPHTHPGIVTAFILNPADYCVRVQWDAMNSNEHYPWELTAEPPAPDYETTT